MDQGASSELERKGEFDASGLYQKAFSSQNMVMRNDQRIKKEVRQIIDQELERIAGYPALANLIVKK